MKKLSKTQIIVLLAGAFVTVLGFIWSDEQAYPTMSKTSIPMIVVGLIAVGFALAPSWNPIKGIA